MSRMRIFLLAFLLVGGVFLARMWFVACACVLPDDFGRSLLSAQLDTVATRELAYYQAHQHFALQLAELPFRPDSEAQVQLVPGADSVLHLSAIFTPRPHVRCTLALRGTDRVPAPATCSREST